MSISLELNGTINIVEKLPGKKPKRTPLNGELALKALIQVIGFGIDAVHADLRGSNLLQKESPDVRRSRRSPPSPGRGKTRQR